MMTAVYTNFGGALVADNRGGTRTQYVSDPLGSLVAETTDFQEVKYTAEYWPYGEVETSQGDRQSPWGFVGLLGYLQDLASLLYVRARHYLPSKARWLTADPLWPSLPQYEYGSNLPILLTDPSGLATNWWLLFLPWGPPVYHCLHGKDVQDYHRCLWCAGGLKPDASQAGEDACASRGFPIGSPGFDRCDSLGYGNAIRHCVWSCLMTRKCGRECARFAADGHENKNIGATGELALDSCYDLYNNSVGRNLAQYNGSCAELCNKALDSGSLGTIMGKGAKIDCSKWRPQPVTWR